MDKPIKYLDFDKFYGVSVSLTSEINHIFTALARKNGMTKSQYLRTILLEQYKKAKKEGIL